MHFFLLKVLNSERIREDEKTENMGKEEIIEGDGEDIQVCLGRDHMMPLCVPLYLVLTGAALFIFPYTYWCKMPYNC